MVDDELFDQLNNLLSTLVESGEAVPKFGLRWVVGVLSKSQSK